MPVCAVYGCNNNNRNQLTKHGINFKLYRFPKDKDFTAKWVNACKRKDEINTRRAVICSIHFSDECKMKSMQQRLLGYSPKNRRCITPDAIPTLYLPGKSMAQNSSRDQRAVTRTRRRLVQAVMKTTCDVTPEKIHEDQIVEPVVDVVKDDNSVSMINDELDNHFPQTIEQLTAEIAAHKKKLNITNESNKILIEDSNNMKETIKELKKK